MISEAKYTKLASLIGENNSEGLATRIEKLRANISVESSFKDYGINEQKWREKLNVMAEHAMTDACTGCNPRAPSVEDMIKVLQVCFNGEKYRY
ncbi:iron-containing alcohol dehydrogenase [Salmonella enterica subsp. enterica serovar Muenchen]|nr:iron-containing alcohol dehydrogenase [Salmonella enterica subsp. enterica serovar Muenchen]ECD1914883.1 iron-containing alcohol dehydrogenase [Salmonella enterica subsp. enterica serovar Bovismorbificans]ECH8730066.1 iron-containing alcohol dehydrogenase [Salmonella enterica subsp. enterica]EGI6307303.1 iron-containing alcohol dehydrogenase [Salmonella enterica subsp. enterica serovar Hindmarsh]